MLLSVFHSFFIRVVTFLRFLRIIILVRVFRLAAQKKELEKVTRRMVRSSPNVVKFTLCGIRVGFKREAAVYFSMIDLSSFSDF